MTLCLSSGATYHPSQANNAYIFPAVGLGALACRATSISDGAFLAAAKALASDPNACPREGCLFPPMSLLRETCVNLAAVVATQLRGEGLARTVLDDYSKAVRDPSLSTYWEAASSTPYVKIVSIVAVSSKEKLATH